MAGHFDENVSTSMNDLINDLTQATSGEVRFDPYSKVLYSADASLYQIEPLGVVIPRTADDVQATLEIAAKYNVPLIARGGGSGLAGQAIGRGLVVDFSKYLRRTLEINFEEHWARVEPGLVCDALNAALQKHGLMFGTEPASSNRATLGGIIANNATGAHSVMYGMTIDHLLSAQGYLADATPFHFADLDPRSINANPDSDPNHLPRAVATLISRCEPFIRDRYPKTWRRASGYSLNYLLPDQQTASQPANWYSPESYPPVKGFNLAKLLAGSEGTLAVMTEAKVNLVPRPKLTGLCVVHFESIAAAADATPTILQCQPSAVELLDRMMIDLTRSVPGYADKLTFIESHPAAVLVVEFYGDSEAHLLSQIEHLETHLRQTGVSQTFVRALTSKQQSNVWGIRKVGLGLLASRRGDQKSVTFMEDVAVPVEKLGDWVRATERFFAEHGLESGYYAHASAGCLHIRPIFSLKTEQGVRLMRTLSAAVLEIVIGLGGALSGEHGDGLARSVWNGKLFGPELYQAFRDLKQIFDPHNRLNPGKIVDAADLTQNLRPPLLPPLTSPPFWAGLRPKWGGERGGLSFEHELGFAAAVEQCNGMGVCRKADGVMCPSFQATRDEEQSTRGRANALRAALSGRLPLTELTSKRMHDVLDLCLECKACKTECPSGVDMAKIKYEWLSHYQAEHGVSLRSWLFANINTVSGVASPVAGLANWSLGLPLAKWLNEKVLGISSERTLPHFASQTFRSWFRSRSTQPAIPGPESQIQNPNSVLLLVDTFTNYNEPHIGQAAVTVLEAAGYNVFVADHGCCGRPMISKGLLKEAKQSAANNIAVFSRFVEQNIPIIGLEPSCLLTLRDEYLDLLPKDSRAQQVADNAFLIEEFIADHLAQFSNLQFSSATPILLHGHCYQKSLTGTTALKTMLTLTGQSVTEIDSGCCGMAGSFGYEAEHYAVSVAIGEDRLFPAIRAADPNVRLAASGTSCRHQIGHGTGRVVKHPVELLAENL